MVKGAQPVSLLLTQIFLLHLAGTVVLLERSRKQGFSSWCALQQWWCQQEKGLWNWVSCWHLLLSRASTPAQCTWPISRQPHLKGSSKLLVLFLGCVRTWGPLHLGTAGVHHRKGLQLCHSESMLCCVMGFFICLNSNAACPFHWAILTKGMESSSFAYRPYTPSLPSSNSKDSSKVLYINRHKSSEWMTD